MRYRIITVLWIIFLILTSLYETEYLLPNVVNSQSQYVSYYDNSFYSNDEVYFTVDKLPYYDDIEYFLIHKNPQGQISIYGNDKYYEKLNYTPPNDQEYYGAGRLDGMQKLGKGPYLDLTKNIYYFNLNSLDNTYVLEEILNYDTTLNYRSEDKEMMYEIDKITKKTDKLGTGKDTEERMSIKYNLFTFLINLFFFILLFLFLFVDISIFSKEIAIKKSLGYPLKKILYDNFNDQLIKSLVYFIPILIPVFLIFYDGSSQAYRFLFSSIYLIVIIYFISNIVYILSYIYVVKKIKIVDTLKGKMNLKVVNSVSMFTNMCSKIIIVLILTLSIIAFYKFGELGVQYTKYIKGNENYVRYYEEQEFYFETGLDYYAADINEIDKYLSSAYEEYNSQGAILNLRTIFTDKGFADTEQYLEDTYDQVMITNTNYMNLIDFPMELSTSKNYLLIPISMKDSTSDIKRDIKDDYGFETFEEVKYYDKYPIYTYNPEDYPISGNIYYPIILVVNDLEESTQNSYIVQSMYYRNDNPKYYESAKLVDIFMSYAKDTIIKGIVALILCIFFMIAIFISSYYMMDSYLEINGKEIAVKRILGYSNFKIYRQFYILDIICYVFFFIYIISIAILFMIPWWIILIYCLIIIALNESNRKMLIHKVEKNKIVNKIKGEV